MTYSMPGPMGTEGDRKSFQSCIAMWNGGSILYSATRQSSTALSSLDSDLISVSDVAREVVWLLSLDYLPYISTNRS